MTRLITASALAAATCLPGTAAVVGPCSPMPQMVGWGPVSQECCYASAGMVAVGAASQGMGGMLPAECLAGPSAEYCKDMDDPTGNGKAAKDEVLPWALWALCCLEESNGKSCGTTVIETATAENGSMNGQVVGGLDADNDKVFDACLDEDELGMTMEAFCGALGTTIEENPLPVFTAAPTATVTAAPSNAPTTGSPSSSPTASPVAQFSPAARASLTAAAATAALVAAGRLLA